MSDELAMTLWPLSLKYSRNFALISLDVMYDSLLVFSQIIENKSQMIAFALQRPGKGQSLFFVEAADSPALELLGRGPGDSLHLGELLADLADGRPVRLAVDALFPQLLLDLAVPVEAVHGEVPGPVDGKGLVVEIPQLAEIFKHSFNGGFREVPLGEFLP